MRFSKGREALFFLGLAIAVGVLWQAYPRSLRVSKVPGLWIFYARATGINEVLFGRPYTARGKPAGPVLRLGRLGLVQEAQTATAGFKGWEWVTTGWNVLGIHGRVVVRRPAPPGDQIVSVAMVDGTLQAVAERFDGSHVRVLRWGSHGWIDEQRRLPLGITTLVSGPQDSVWVLTAEPDQARLTEIAGGHTQYHSGPLEPQGTAGFVGGMPVIPYAVGQNTFGYWTGTRHDFSSVYHAALSVTDTTPLWGLGVKGMIPYRDGAFQTDKLVPWPRRQDTTPVILTGGGSWIAILDGFSQGQWFNVETGQFGPPFQINTPWWAVVRAASLGS